MGLELKRLGRSGGTDPAAGRSVGKFEDFLSGPFGAQAFLANAADSTTDKSLAANNLRSHSHHRYGDIGQYNDNDIIIIIIIPIILTNLFSNPASILPQTTLSAPTTTPSTSPNHLNRLPDHFLRHTRPLPATYATPSSPNPLHRRQLLHRRALFARKGPHHPLPHPIPVVVLPFIVERTHDNGSLLISHFMIGTAYQLKGVGLVTPLVYLLTIWLTSSVRAAHTAPGGVDPRVDPAGVRPPERTSGLHI